MTSATPTASSWDELARAAGASGYETETEVLRELVVFPLGADRYALPVERIREIVRYRPITPVPRVPSEILGVISLRSGIVQVMDLAQRLGGTPGRPTRTSRIVILHGGEEGATGLLVDTVTSVLRVGEDAFRDAPAGDSGFVSRLCEDNGEFVSVLSLERVLSLGT